MAPKLNQRWNLTRHAFAQLMERLGPDAEASSREYEGLRARLIDFFDWRGALSPEALADETFDRVARKLEQGETVQHLTAYFHGVARRVWLESEKQRAREEASLKAFPAPGPASDALALETQIACLERCLDQLPEDSRDLIVSYYLGVGRSHLEGRRVLAARLGITYATLKTRAHRIRARLDQCLQRCLEERNREPIGAGSHTSERGAGH